MAWIWDTVDTDTINRVRTILKFLHEHETDLIDLKEQVDKPDTGLKARLEAEPDGGLEAIQQFYPKITTTQEYYDILYIVSAVVGNAVDSGRAALASVNKL